MAQVLAIIVAGVVDNVILGAAADFPGSVDVSATSPRPGPGWLYNGSSFTPPTAAGATGSRRITRLGFKNRLTQQERITLDLASIDDPAAPAASRQLAAALRDLLSQVGIATFIDLQRADTRAGVQQLEVMGLLGAGRALQILDAPITPEEAYNGP